MKFRDMAGEKAGNLSSGKKVRKDWQKSTGRPKELPSKAEEDLLAEMERLRAENTYLKTCKY